MGAWVVSTQVPEAVCPEQAGDGPAVPSACVPSTATNAPARLRAVQTVKKPNLYLVPLHREKTEASPLDHERNSQVLFPVRLEKGFLGQARGAGTGLLGGRLSLGRPPKEAPTQGSQIRGSFCGAGALEVWAADLLRCATWALVWDTGPQAPPPTCRIRTSGVGHSTLEFNKAPHSGGFRGRPGMLRVWMRPARRVSPGVGGGAWGLGPSEQPHPLPQGVVQRAPFSRCAGRGKGFGSLPEKHLTGRNAEESPLLKEAHLPGADKRLSQRGEHVSTSPLVTRFRD